MDPYGHYYFTFGSDHLGGQGLGKYVEIKGFIGFEEARKLMFAIFGPHWAFQYTEPEFTNMRYSYERYMVITVDKD